MASRPRLRTVLLTVNLLILLLPVAGFAALRLYENELVRSTEAQLLVQGAFVREAYRREYRRAVAAGPEIELDGEARPGPRDPDQPLTPLLPQLDISRASVRPPAPPAEDAAGPAEIYASAAGAAIMPSLQEAGRSTLAGIRVVDAHGVVVATTRSELGQSLAAREEVGRALDGEDARLLRRRVSDDPDPPLWSLSRGQRYRVFVALPVIEDDRVVGAVVLSRTPLDIAKALYLKRGPLAVAAIVALAVVVLVSVLTSFTISRPVRALIRQAEDVARGRGAVRPLRSPGTHELARLSEALSDMARTLQERAEYIRTFASHVSHEFKTPLTTLRGTTELLRDHLDEMSAEERERFLGNLMQTVQRMERLVRRLMELARADALRPGDELSRVDAVVRECAERQRETAGLQVQLDAGAKDTCARIAPEILTEIVDNLLENARQHAGPDARVKITTRIPTAAARDVVLTVSDDGAGISPANAERVFTPFFTTAREHGGSGLGLSIVRALLEAHGGSIELTQGDTGATFSLRLPLAL